MPAPSLAQLARSSSTRQSRGSAVPWRAEDPHQLKALQLPLLWGISDTCCRLNQGQTVHVMFGPPHLPNTSH